MTTDNHDDRAELAKRIADNLNDCLDAAEGLGFTPQDALGAISVATQERLDFLGSAGGERQARSLAQQLCNHPAFMRGIFIGETEDRYVMSVPENNMTPTDAGLLLIHGLSMVADQAGIDGAREEVERMLLEAQAGSFDA